MGIVDWYVNRAARKFSLEYAVHLEALLNAMPDEGTMRETKYRDLVRDHVAGLDDVEVKREAGIQGTGTKIDLYAHALNHDFLITIKKGLNEQKVKILKGEIDVFLDHWRARIPGNTTYVFVHIYGLSQDHDREALNGLHSFIERVEKHHKDFMITCTIAGTTKAARRRTSRTKSQSK